MNIRSYLLTAEHAIFHVQSTDFNLLSCLVRQNGRFGIIISQIACQSNSRRTVYSTQNQPNPGQNWPNLKSENQNIIRSLIINLFISQIYPRFKGGEGISKSKKRSNNIKVAQFSRTAVDLVTLNNNLFHPAQGVL